MLLIDIMSKEEIVDAVFKLGCNKLKDLDLEKMDRTAILKHLYKCKCPLIVKFLQKHVKICS